jgi:hypothetical protein
MRKSARGANLRYEKCKEYRRRWAKANPEKRRETLRRWVAANPEKVRAKNERSQLKRREKAAAARMAKQMEMDVSLTKRASRWRECLSIEAAAEPAGQIYAGSDLLPEGDK